MGSTFKIFSIAAAIEQTEINLDTKFDARNPIKISNFMIKDYHPQNKILSTKEIFLKSSNIGSSLIALRLGNKKLKNFYRDLGLLNGSKINLLEKSRPIVPKKWGKVETATLSYGHGLSISPMQMIESAALLLNNNTNFISTIKKRNINDIYKKNNFISFNTNKVLLQLMLENVLVGTGKKARVEGYNIGGKTATGEKVNNNGKYDKTKLVSSFLSVFPIDNPQYISLVLFDEPSFNKKNKSFGATGGITAAPTTAKILKRILPILGISKNFDIKPDIIVNDKEKLNLAAY